MRPQLRRSPGLRAGREDGPAALAGVHDRVVAGRVQAVVQEIRRAVRQAAHFALS